MVLISMMLACMHAQSPKSNLEPAPVSTVVTLASPQSAEMISAPPSVQDAINTALKNEGLNIISGAKASDIQSMGTSAGRIDAVLRAANGKLSVLIDATARPRAEMTGRYPWQIELTITVAKEGRDPLVDTSQIPVSLTFIHQGEADALSAASTRIARRTSLLVDRFRRDR